MVNALHDPFVSYSEISARSRWVGVELLTLALGRKETYHLEAQYSTVLLWFDYRDLSEPVSQRETFLEPVPLASVDSYMELVTITFCFV